MIRLKTEDEIVKIRAAGKILVEVSQMVREAAKEGTFLSELDTLARREIESRGGAPSFLGYMPDGARKPYPASMCTSLNDVIVHGLPTARRLRNGDLLKLDFGVYYSGYHADAAWTVMMGDRAQAPSKTQDLVEATEQALAAGIAAAVPGGTLGDIGFAIESIVRGAGFFVVEGLTGHGIGKKLHEDPYVWNTGRRGRGMKLKAGMVLAIEPMTAIGTSKIRQTEGDEYTTADGSLSAHFEHTVAITEYGPEILTKN